MRNIGAIVVISLGLSCGTKTKAEITEVAMDDREQRRELMEATLRVLDGHPRYVDEFFALTRKHPQTLERFLGNTAASLHDPELAARVARHLVKFPEGLEQIMIATIEAARPVPQARTAIVDAMQARANVAAAFLVEHPEQLATVSEALVEQALDHPDTRRQMTALLEALVTE